jgi:transposase
MGVPGLSVGAARRNFRLAALRSVLTVDTAIVGVDLASNSQVAVVTDHDSRVLARRAFRGSPWCAPAILAWAEGVAAKTGFTGVVVACEPTGHRWKPLLQHTRQRGVTLVCVNPMLVARAREAEDFTRNRTDTGDAVIIARLASQLHCFEPYQPEGAWARLRHLGARRNQVLTRRSAARQALRDLLQCAWPEALACARKPLDSLTFRAAMLVSTDPTVIAGMSLETFAEAVKSTLAAWGGKRRNWRVLHRLHAAARTPGGVACERDALTERAAYAIHDWLHEHWQARDVERRMEGILEELGYTSLIDSLPGLSRVGAAAILAETGDPTRYSHPRALVKHAGLCPRANESGAFRGKTTISGRGRPGLRTAAWRAIWGLLPHNGVYAQRYQHLTTRPRNPLNDGQARTALAAALLRQLHAMLTRGEAWNPTLAAPEVTMPTAA